MRRQAEPAELAAALRSRAMLAEAGWTERRIRAAVLRGELARVRRGWYVDADWLRTLWPESHHLLHVLAVERDARGADLIYSHASAAVLWGLPLYRILPRRVHVLPLAVGRHSVPDVHRHEGTLHDDEIAVRHGMRCTSLERTVRDVARTLTIDAAIVAADAALSLVAGRRQAYREDVADRWRTGMLDALATPARGVRQARRVVQAADGRAESAGESVSRMHLLRLGFRRIALQVRVPAPDGREYSVDFGLDDVAAFGEFDGIGKYTDEALRSGRTAEEVYLAEKRREDWIRGTTRRRLVRWGSRELDSPASLAVHLASFGIHPPRH